MRIGQVALSHKKDLEMDVDKTGSITTVRRGRPAVTAEKRAAMRARIAEAAKHLFQTEGYGQVSMRRIANEIGCAPMTLYKYYDAKIDILCTLWSDIFVRVFDHLEKSNPPGTEPAQRLKTLASTYVAYWLEHTDQYRLVFMADGVTQSDVSIFVDKPEIITHFEIFAAVIIECHDGSVEPDILKRKLDALICFLHGIAHNLITINGYPWTQADEIVAIAVDGVTALNQ